MTTDKNAAPNNDTSSTDAFETRMPEKGDQLFVELAWAYDAQLVRDPKERFYRMPMGYKRAGDLLIDQATTNVVDRANVIYAALFCYRQAIELYLKSLIDEFGNETIPRKNTHDLGQLWKRFMCIVNERGISDMDFVISAEKLITEMQNADQRSDGFRFPTDTVGAPFNFSDRGIDLSNVREVMQGLANFFECTSLEFSHGHELASEE